MVHHGTMIASLLAVIVLASEVAGVRYVPKWKKQVNESNLSLRYFVEKFSLPLVRHAKFQPRKTSNRTTPAMIMAT